MDPIDWLESAAEEDRLLWLRRLRFPKELEREFRADHLRKSLNHHRFMMGLALFVVVVLGIRPQGGWELLWRYGIVCPGLLGLLLYSYHSSFARVSQSTLAAVLLAIGLGLVAVISRGNGPGSELEAHNRPFMFALNLIVLMVPIYTVCRLYAATAAFVNGMLLLAGGVMALRTFHAPPMAMVYAATGVLLVNLFGLLACVSSERYFRREFLVQRLLEAEQRKSESLLLNILPAPVAERLKTKPGTIADSFAEVTVLFADLVEFTPLAARLSAPQVVELLNEIFSAFDRLAEQYGLEKIKTVGDTYMVVGGLPLPREDHAEAVAELALAMRDEVARLNAEKPYSLRVRIGINTGPVVAGVIGTKKFVYDLWGDTVNMASRMETQGVEDCIQVTEATYERLRSRFNLEERGEIEVRGRGTMRTYLLRGRRHGVSE